jgi:hypothetical protein
MATECKTDGMAGKVGRTPRAILRVGMRVVRQPTDTAVAPDRRQVAPVGVNDAVDLLLAAHGQVFRLRQTWLTPAAREMVQKKEERNGRCRRRA